MTPYQQNTNDQTDGHNVDLNKFSTRYQVHHNERAHEDAIFQGDTI